MGKLTVVVKRNADYENGMYGLSAHNKSAGATHFHPIKNDAELKVRLVWFGVTESYADDIINRIKKKHKSVKIEFDEV